MNPIIRGFTCNHQNKFVNDWKDMDKLPEDIIFDIFARLPVKFILRCKSVCKSWRSHILNSNFVQLHMVRTSTNPGNHSFVVYGDCYHQHGYCYPEHRLRLINKNFLNIANDFNLPPKINKLYRRDADYDGLKIVGSCNGLLCVAYKRTKQRLRGRLHLWNPATRQLKDINYNYPLNINQNNYYIYDVSFGFGFDLANSDYKVVRIVTNTQTFVSRAQVYSQVYFRNRKRNKNRNTNKNRQMDAWKEIAVEFKFKIHEYVCPAVVKGSPYWIIKHNPVDQQFAMVWFNMQSEKFSTISLPDGMCHKLPSKFNLFEFKESVAVAARPLDQDISIWTLDDDSCWIKKCTITTPKLRRILGCLETGEFVGNIRRQLVLYDSVKEVVKPTQLSMGRPKIYNYRESLVNLN